MRKLNVISMVTLDGVMQAPGGPEEDTSGGFKYGGWVIPFNDEFMGDVLTEEMVKIPYDLLLGRKTFEIWAAYWPYHNEGPGIGFNRAIKYVVSNTLSTHEWKKSVFIKGNVVDEIKKLKAQDGPQIQVHGSSGLIQTLLKNDLVDELWLKIGPITLGPGKRLFAEGTIPAAFTLKDARVSPKGVIVAYYERAGEVKTGSFG